MNDYISQADLAKRIDRVVAASIEQVNRQLPVDRKIDMDERSPLFGAEGNLDSLGVVNLIVALQKFVEEEFEMELQLRLEEVIAEDTSPFRTLETLVNYLTVELA